MISLAARLSSLLISVAILVIGHGLQLALLPIRADALGWSDFQIGLTGSSYFAGLLLGCLTIPYMVRRVGHIRVFTVLTAITTAALLGIALLDNIVGWIVLRLLIGWSIAGLYLVIESWLNEEVDNRQRGSLVSLYTVTVLLAMAIGQLLLNTASPSSFQIIILAALFVVIAAIPIGLTPVIQPDPIPKATFSPLAVLHTSRVAAVASFVSGIVTGCYYGLGPLYAKLLALDIFSISIVMASGVLGGAVFLWPVGRLSDRVDRRVVILMSMAGAIAACVLTFIVSVDYLPFLFFLFGGCIMPIYALSLAHAADNVDHSFLEVGTGILIMNATGAIVGPTIASLFMEFLGAPAFFGFCGGILLLGAATVAILIRQHAARRPHFAPFEMATTAAAQGAVEFDPRSDAKHEADNELP